MKTSPLVLALLGAAQANETAINRQAAI